MNCEVCAGLGAVRKVGHAGRGGHVNELPAVVDALRHEATAEPLDVLHAVVNLQERIARDEERGARVGPRPDMAERRSGRVARSQDRVTGSSEIARRDPSRREAAVIPGESVNDPAHQSGTATGSPRDLARSRHITARVRALVRERPGITSAELRSACSLTRQQTITVLNNLTRARLIERQGRGASTRLYPPGGAPKERFEDLTYEQKRVRTRNMRKRSRRSRTINASRISQRERDAAIEAVPEALEPSPRPRTRAGCASIERPCPYVSCVHHLYLDVDPRNGSIKLNFPDLDPDELKTSCALDVADEGGASLEQVGEAINTTRERVRQIETRALRRIELSHGSLLAEMAGEARDISKRRRLPLHPEDV